MARPSTFIEPTNATTTTTTTTTTGTTTMRLDITTTELKAALIAARPVSPKTSIHAILERTVEWEQSTAGASFYATDLTIAVEHILSTSNVEGSGRAVFAITPALAFLNACEGKRVTLTSADGTVELRTEEEESLALTEMDADDYPKRWEFAGSDHAARITFGSLELRGMLGEVLPVIARQPGRYAMHCAQVELKHDVPARFVATDGRRLVVSKYGRSAVKCGEIPEAFPGAVLFPRPLLEVVHKALPKRAPKGQSDPLAQLVAGDCAIDGSDLVGFQVGQTSYLARAGAGEFPLYDVLIRPGSGGKRESFARVEVDEVCKRLRLVASGCNLNNPAITFRVSSPGKLLLTASRALC